MIAKVDQPTTIESRNTEVSATTISNGSTSGPKVTKFAAKSGFVIPKNKLSGSLVPIFKGGKQAGVDGAETGESRNQAQRKTKWGPDLTQDGAVRRGRALAYQTRLDQITQQLKSEVLEPVENQDSETAAQQASTVPPSSQIDSKSNELLELEWREIIGEILKLNPGYKAPPDYKPLVKEDFVIIPVKDYPGYNFVGLIFGSGSETQKRLEKETGAKIQIYGTKSNTGEKIEISPSDAKETKIDFTELSIHVSADTFEKVDSAVSVIELLITSVLENLAANKDGSLTQSQVTSVSVEGSAVLNQRLAQPVGTTQTPQYGKFQYEAPWSQGVSHQTSMHNTSGFLPLPNNTSAPVHINNIPAQLSTVNSSSMLSLFPHRPNPATGFNTMLQNLSLVPAGQPPTQVLPNSDPSRSFSMPPMELSSAEVQNSVSLPFPGGQSLPIGLSPIARPSMSSLPQPVPTVSTGNFAPGNMQSNPFPMCPLQGYQPMVLQPDFQSRPSNLQFSSGPIHRPFGNPGFANAPSSRLGPSSMVTPVQSPPTLPNSSMNPMGSASISSFSSFMPRNIGPQDFTFQPHPASQTVPRLALQPAPQSNIQRPMIRSPAAQAPSFQLPMTNRSTQLDIHAFPRPRVGEQMVPSEIPFMGNLAGSSVSPRTPGFSQPSQMSLFGPRNLGQAPQVPNLPGPFPPRPVQLQNYPTTSQPRGIFMPTNQLFARNVPLGVSRPSTFASGGQQIYDPFSPTSVCGVPKLNDHGETSKQENAADNEDPMSSVGAK